MRYIRGNWKDPQPEETNEIDDFIESQIIMDGMLTANGQSLYENTMMELVYDEIQGEWIYV